MLKNWALVKANRKQLKANPALGVRKLNRVFLASKLGKFLFFGGYFDFSPLDFLDLDNLANFWLFDFLDFLAVSTPSSPNPSTLPLPSFPWKAGLLLSFLLEADLLPLFLLGAGLLVVFNIKVSGAAILLKPWINHQ